MIDVGGGAFMSGSDPVEALFKVDFTMAVPTGPARSHTSFVLARLNSRFAANGDGLNFVDLQFDSLGWQWHDGNLREDGVRGYLGFSFLNIDVQRDVTINNDISARISFLGFRGGMQAEVDEDTVFLLKGALDVLGMAYTRRLDDGADSNGESAGGFLETGIQIHNAFRVVVGDKYGATLGKPYQYRDGAECESYIDYWGYERTHCRDTYATGWDDVRSTNTTYLSAGWNIAKHFGIFGEARYSVYDVRDDSGQTYESNNGRFQLLFGAKISTR
jgi:hypothetical protein